MNHCKYETKSDRVRVRATIMFFRNNVMGGTRVYNPALARMRDVVGLMNAFFVKGVDPSDCFSRVNRIRSICTRVSNALHSQKAYMSEDEIDNWSRQFCVDTPPTPSQVRKLNILRGNVFETCSVIDVAICDFNKLAMGLTGLTPLLTAAIRALKPPPMHDGMGISDAMKHEGEIAVTDDGFVDIEVVPDIAE